MSWWSEDEERSRVEVTDVNNHHTHTPPAPHVTQPQWHSWLIRCHQSTGQGEKSISELIVTACFNPFKGDVAAAVTRGLMSGANTTTLTDVRRCLSSHWTPQGSHAQHHLSLTWTLSVLTSFKTINQNTLFINMWLSHLYYSYHISPNHSRSNWLLLHPRLGPNRRRSLNKTRQFSSSDFTALSWCQSFQLRNLNQSCLSRLCTHRKLTHLIWTACGTSGVKVTIKHLIAVRLEKADFISTGSQGVYFCRKHSRSSHYLTADYSKIYCVNAHVFFPPRCDPKVQFRNWLIS